MRLTRRQLLALAAGVPFARAHAAERGTLRLSHVLEWDGKESLDPASPRRMFPCVEQLYNRLVKLDDQGRPDRDLALTWRPDETASTWTFNLRPDVSFHDGTKLVAADVVATLKHVLDPALASPGAAALEIVDLARLTAPDPRTVVVGLKRPHADFPVLLAHYSCYVFRTPGVGTGPFKMETFAPEGTTVLVANDAYWDGPPGLARIELVGIADQEARVNALLADQLDYLGGCTAAAAGVVAKDGRFRLDELATGAYCCMAMRVDRAPFDRVEVRQALKLAADRPRLIKAALGGHGRVAGDQPVWAGDPYALTVEPARDVARAKALLAQAGFKDGVDVTLVTAPVTDGLVPMAVAYREMAAEAGIRVTIRQSPADGYWERVWRQEAFCCSSWGERPADQALAELFRAGAPWNETGWSSKPFEAKLDAARRELDFEKRRTLYRDAATLVAAEAGSLIPFFRNQMRAVSRKVQGIPAERRDFDWAKVSLA